MTDTTNHAEVIRDYLEKIRRYRPDDEMPDPSGIPGLKRMAYSLAAENAISALDALTRELEAHRSAQPIIRQQLIEQSARIATLERTLSWIVNCTDSEMGDGDGARAIARIALAPPQQEGTMSEPEGIRVNLDDIMGYTEVHSRWEPCNCGDEWCGHFVNWTVKVDRYGNRTKNPEWIGVRTICPGPKKRS